jgi:hypothetical protein
MVSIVCGVLAVSHIGIGAMAAAVLDINPISTDWDYV